MSATTDMLASTSTPDKVESRLGTLEFDDGAPSEATAALLYDHLDFIHGVEAFLGAAGRSLAAIRRGFLTSASRTTPHLPGADGFGVGVPDRELRHGLLLEVHRSCGRPDGDRRAVDRGAVAVLGMIDDMWFRWVTDFGLPGPDRGQGGRYLLGGAGLRRAAARQRLPRLPRSHDTRDRDRPGVHDRQRSHGPAVEVIRTGFRSLPTSRVHKGTAVGKFPRR